MRTGSMKRFKQAAIVAMGVVVIDVGACLPKNYFYDFAAAGQATILDAFADTLFTSITDTLFPAPEDETTADGE